MKVVLFCGGLGTRMKEYSETIPKPMVEIGYRPILWHLMRYYAHFGHKEFILCLGYKGDYIKKYFLDYDECLSNDFILSNGGQRIQLFDNDTEDWTITFVDTGMNCNLGQRLLAVKDHLNGHDVFMANYADGLTDLDLDAHLDHFHKQDKVASFLAVKPSHSYHVVSLDDKGTVTDINAVADSNIRINGGYFIFKKEIFDYIHDGEDLVHEPFQRLISADELIAFRNQGFWASIDTFKEKKLLDSLHDSGVMPWALWRNGKQDRKHRILNNGHRPSIERSPLS